ncbi:hypothetical protein BDK51DRAFT_28139 [Blyttiomyces helicus]|uniref:Uncharacterized protein n=1 Tax=Blyttiomyces helicus TaxID=388810 RepID=A0A4P9WH04_9FUNG|nr:hypothetical protein BDK51DRAFT_28139 [Blyttiomyces helicus]|eukprot:RKO89796.1 hypothetical protein BDK51DRAFT_28139 [Blyttiomyces helicus]
MFHVFVSPLAEVGLKEGGIVKFHSKRRSFGRHYSATRDFTTPTMLARVEGWIRGWLWVRVRGNVPSEGHGADRPDRSPTNELGRLFHSGGRGPRYWEKCIWWERASGWRGERHDSTTNDSPNTSTNHPPEEGTKTLTRQQTRARRLFQGTPDVTLAQVPHR